MPRNRLITLTQYPDGNILLTAGFLSRAYKVELSPDEAQHLSNRLQAFVKGQYTLPETIIKD